MKKGYLYTVVYMVLLTAVLSLGLAVANEAFSPRIEEHKRLQEERALLYVFDLEKGLDDGGVHQRFEERIREETLGGLACYALVEDGEVQGYAFPFEGAGLWGSLRGYLGVDAGMEHTTGLVFTYQNETPGLGGRIDEEAYKAQFRGLPLAPDRPLAYGVREGYQLDGITGATQTSAAVLRTVNRLMAGVFAAEEAGDV